MTSSVKHVIDAAHDQSIARLGTAANGSPFTNPERWKPIFEGSPEILNLRNVLVRGDKVSKNISFFIEIWVSADLLFKFSRLLLKFKIRGL